MARWRDRRPADEFQNRGNIPIQREVLLPSTVSYQCINSADANATITIWGKISDGTVTSEILYAATSGATASVNTWSKIDRVVRTATTGICYLQTPSNGPLARYYGWEVTPDYRVIKVSKANTGYRMVYRKHTAVIKTVNDYIPLNSRFAILQACKGVRLAQEGNYDSATACFTFATQLITEEQNARQDSDSNAATGANPAANLTITSRDVVLVSDIYDDACTIFGSIGRQHVFDKITAAIELLSNKSPWDSLIGYADVFSAAGGYFVMPRYVEAILALNFNGFTGFPRNMWYEFNLNGWGENENATPGTWDIVGYVPTVNLWPVNGSGQAIPKYITGIAENTADIGTEITVHGLDGNGIAIPGGCTITLAATAIATTQEFTKIDRISKPDTIGFVRVSTMTSGSEDLLMAHMYPDETEARYMAVRVPQSDSLSRIRVRFRKRWNKISSMYDMIPLRSRMAILTELKSIRARDTADPQAAGFAAQAVLTWMTELETQAVQMVKDEMTAMNIGGAGDALFSLNEFIGVRDAVVVGDIYDDASSILGDIGRQQVYDKITIATEVISNKAQWDSLIGYCDIATSTGGYYVLPRYVETVLSLNANGAVGFPRNMWYEFNLDGWGEQANATPGTWDILGYVPVVNPFPLGESYAITAICENLTDAGTIMRVFGLDNYGNPVVDPTDHQYGLQISLGSTIAATSIHFSRIDRVTKPATVGFVRVSQVISGAESMLLNHLYPDETEARYLALRLPLMPNSSKIRIRYRKRWNKIGSLYDIIHLRSRLAITTQIRANKLRETDPNNAAILEAQALQMVKDEQAIAALKLDDGPLFFTNQMIGVRDAVVVGDIYDEMAGIAGEIGQQKVFDALTTSIELLANKSEWDSLVGYCDIATNTGGYFVMPRYVETILALNVNGFAGFPRNMWYEFNLDGFGESAAAAPGTWDLIGFVPVVNPIPFNTSTTIAAINENTADAGTILRVYGLDASGNPVIDPTDHQMGLKVTSANSLVATSQSFSRIDRIVKPSTIGFVRLVQVASSAEGLLLGHYYPDELEPRYLAVRLPSLPSSSRIRIRYRRRWNKITSFYQTIPLRSRHAILTEARAIKMRETDPQSAAILEQQAVQMVRDEQNAMALKLEDDALFATNQFIGVRDAVVVGDIYDDVCEIVGNIGQQKVFDRITTATEIIANKSQWDSLIGYCDIATSTGGYFVMPRYVEAVLALNVNGLTGFPRNMWYEFNLDGFGETQTAAPGTWDLLGYVPVVNPFPFNESFTISAINESTADVGTVIRVYGLDQNNNPVIDPTDHNPGLNVTSGNSLVATAIQFSRIDAINKPKTQGFIRLVQVVSGAEGLLLGHYYPDELSPRYMAIKLPKLPTSSRIRIRYRKRWNKISGFYDIIPLRSPTH